MPNRYTYIGLLDDFARRHGDTAITGVDDFNDKLVLAVLFSDPVVVNDGYVLLHPTVRSALQRPSSSPFKALVECGFVKLLTRNAGDLGHLADLMAANGITSAQTLLADDGYRRRYQPLLEAWAGQLRSDAFDAWLPWPRIRLDDVFRSVAQQVLASSTLAAELPAADLEAFTRQLADTPRRRTEWEDVANSLRAADRLATGSYRQLMRAANEAYQYTWGCALLQQLPGVRVLTRLPRHLGALDAAEFELPARPRQPVEVLIPDRAFVKKAVGDRWGPLAAMVTPGHELNRLKHAFLQVMRQHFAGELPDQRLLKKAASDYTQALSRHFGQPAGVPVVFDLSFVAASAYAGTLAGGLPGAAIGAAVGVVGVAASHLGAPRLLWRLTAPSPKKWLVHRRLEAPPDTTSCFQLNADQARVHTQGAAAF